MRKEKCALHLSLFFCCNYINLLQFIDMSLSVAVLGLTCVHHQPWFSSDGCKIAMIVTIKLLKQYYLARVAAGEAVVAWDEPESTAGDRSIDPTIVPRELWPGSRIFLF